ncbi:uncharacterized protein [Blastocystis hominis]|uniref:Cyclin n=1 Tax=Blastocystis hominis TaxID=12968 RepID=D8LX05_BLAHO|nr:uncharacterized protein [Blastocystis hominis]CBK20800.2 unnamed protein product [Blastocystis hominis]|eukprot:XP_012894848.1 uncharacterized protein [Blastocystis hominis]
MHLPFRLRIFIYRYFNCSAECYLLSLIYINRVIRINRFIINTYSVHRLILTSMMVAAKYFDDVYYTNTFYAEVGGISVNEINNLEVDFLCRIGFNLFVSTEEFRQYYKDIADHCSNCFTCCRDCVIIIILTRIDSIRLPELINCGPKGEAPILRYRETPANTNFSFNGMFSSNMGTFSGYGYPSNGGCYSGYSFGSNQGMLASMNYASMASYASDLGNITPTYQMY